MKNIPIVLVVVLGALGVLGSLCVYTVNERQQALILQFGAIEQVRQEAGLYFKSPLQNVVYLEKRTLLLDLPEQELIASDKRRLIVDAISRYKISDPLKFYQRLQTVQNAEGQILTLINSNLRETLGNATSAQILTEQRAALMQNIATNVNDKVEDLGLVIIDIRIKRTDLPRQNTATVVQRMIAERKRIAEEQRALGRKVKEEIQAKADRDRVVILANAQRQSDILRGQGEAERNRIFAESFGKDPQFFGFYRSMQAYKKSLSGKDTTMILSPDSDFFRYFRSDSGK